MSESRRQVLVLTFTPFRQEPRALKQVRFLKDHYQVTTAGFGPAPFPDVPHVEVPQVRPHRWGVVGRLLGAGLLALHWYSAYLAINAWDREALRLLGGRAWDVVIAHDLKALEASLRLAPSSGVVLDLHEYAPRQEEHSAVWRWLIAPYFRWMCRTKVPQVAEVVTVGQGIADEYRRQFGFTSTVVVNATPFADHSPGEVTTPIRLVHSGGVAPQRRLDIMVDGVRQSTADVTLDLYLVGEGSPVLADLKERAAGDPRIRFCEPVPYSQLVATLNTYDVGLSIFPPTTFNLAWCLPNKFFDYVQARLGVIVGPSPEMAGIVTQVDFGDVLTDFEPHTLARALEALTPERVTEWKRHADAHASELSSESQGPVWLELMARMMR